MYAKEAPAQLRLEVGNRIKVGRVNRGWSQERVAELLSCSRRRVIRVEQGLAEFSIAELELLADRLGLSVLFFLER